MMLLELDAAHMYDTAAENQGKVFVGTEIGGGGSADATSTKIAKRGILNVLMHAGILPGEPERHSSINVDSHDAGCFITCEHSGLLELRNDLGDEVQKGDLIAVYMIRSEPVQRRWNITRRSTVFWLDGTTLV